MPYQAGQAYVQVVPSMRGFVREIRKDIRKQMGTNPPEIPVTPDADWGVVKRQATKEGAEAAGGFAKAFRTRVEAALSNLRDIRIGADTSEADLEIAGLRTRLQALRDIRIGVDMDADEAHREIQAISGQLHRIAGEDARIDVQLEASKASAELSAIKRRVDDLDGDDVEIDVHVDRNGTARAGIFFLARSINGLMLLGAALAPAFIPGIALITAAVGGLASALAGVAIGAGAFIAAVIPGITAVSEVMKAQEQAAKDAATSTVSNMRQQIQQQAAAEQAARNLSAAQSAQQRAQEDLTRAREDARVAVADLREQVSDLTLAEEGAEIALIRAQQRQKEVNDDSTSSALDRREAALRVAEAEDRVSDVRRDQKRATEDLNEAERVGINGSDQVRDAAQRVREATAAVTAAQEAQTRQAQLARLEAEEGSAAQRNLGFALAELTPMQRVLMDGWIRLRDAFTGWSRSLEPATIPVLVQGMDLLGQLFPLLTPIVEASARAFGRLLDSASEALTSPFWRDFFDFLARTAGPNTEAFGKIFGNLAIVFANLLMAFEPFATKFLDWLVRLTDSWVTWSDQLAGSEGFNNFMTFVAENGPRVAAFFDALWRAIGNLVSALAPLSGPLLDGLTAVLNFIASLPPSVLAGVFVGLLAIGFALNSIALAAALINANPVILIIGAVLGLGAALYVAYQRSEEFRRVVDKVFADVKQAALDMWNGGLKDVFEALVELWEDVVAPAAIWLWNNIIKPYFKLMIWFFTKVWAPVITWMAKNVIAPAIRIITDILKFFGRILNWLWRNVAKPVFKFLGDGFSALGRFFKKIWDNWLFPVVDLFIKHAEWIGRGFENLWKDIKRIWGDIANVIRVIWHRDIKPLIVAFGEIWARYVQPLVDAFVRTFSTAWDKATETVKDAINWVIRNVFNKGIVAGFNVVARFFGSKEMGDIPEIGKPPPGSRRDRKPSGTPRRTPGFAEGGIIPGTRTKQDSVLIHARPGEPVMVPEFADAVGGAAGVHRLNRMAERGQLRALLGDHAEGFASGGIVSYKGHTFTQAMVDRIKNAERLAGYAFRIFQGGFRPRTSYSGGTHMKDAIDYGPVRSSAVDAARKSGIVAWDRTGKGNWAPHIHGIPVPGGGVQLSPSARGQYESYTRGGDGLGGTDSGISVAGGGGLGSIPQKILNVLTAPLKWLKNLVTKRLGDKFGSSRLAQMVLGIPRKISSAVKDYFAENLSGGDPATSGFRVIGKSAGAAQTYAAGQLGKYGWGRGQMPSLIELWNRESRWNYRATNPSSGAYGIPQSLPPEKMRSAGSDWRTNPATQVDWGLGYIKGRHGSPSGALGFHDRNNWYDDGGMLPPIEPWNGTRKPEPVLTDSQWNAIMANAQRGMDAPEIHVYVGDQEITELVRVEMRERDQTMKRYVTAIGDGYS